ncbi:MAG: iron-molybdenum cofactor-binding protein [Epsilonproteobacteria bacterium]|nr:iron-molybdenum cofactor-binding protein [Campylobacterota bacterium]
MIIAFPTNNQKRVASHIGLAKGFLIINSDTQETKFIPNPLRELISQESHSHSKRGLQTGRIIPELLRENNVDVFVAKEFGEGMLRNLKFAGITPKTTSVLQIDEILQNPALLEDIAIPSYEMPQRGFRQSGLGRGFGRGRGMGRGRGFGFN